MDQLPQQIPTYNFEKVKHFEYLGVGRDIPRKSKFRLYETVIGSTAIWMSGVDPQQAYRK